MTAARLDRVVREAGARIIAALAARYRDLDLAEEAFADACLRAASASSSQVPDQQDAWLYRVAQRCALDRLRRRRVRERMAAEAPELGSEDEIMDEITLIPD